MTTSEHPWQVAWLEALAVERNLSAKTVEAYRLDVSRLLTWLKVQRSVNPDEAAEKDISFYVGELARTGLSRASQRRTLAAIRSFYAYGIAEEWTTTNPAKGVVLPRLRRKLPRVLSVSDVERLLALPNVTDFYGLRDRAILELLYSAGLRASECVELRLRDLSMAQGFVRVLGKGGKTRIIPIGGHARVWVESYLSDSRGKLLGHRVSDWLFLAMACHKLGRTAEAKRWMDKTVEWASVNRNTIEHEWNWRGRLEYRTLQNEAEALLSSGQKR